MVDGVYAWHLRRGFPINDMIRIRATVPPNGRRFYVNFQVDNAHSDIDVPFHLSFRYGEEGGYLVNNSFTADDGWADEERYCLHLPHCMEFEILVLNTPDGFRVALNNSHFCSFLHRQPHATIKYLYIDEEIDVRSISQETNTPMRCHHRPGYPCH